MGKQPEKTAALPPPVPSEEDLIAGGKVMSVFDHLAELHGAGVADQFVVAASKAMAMP